MSPARTYFDKVWDDHLITALGEDARTAFPFDPFREPREVPFTETRHRSSVCESEDCPSRSVAIDKIRRTETGTFGGMVGIRSFGLGYAFYSSGEAIVSHPVVEQRRDTHCVLRHGPIGQVAMMGNLTRG